MITNSMLSAIAVVTALGGGLPSVNAQTLAATAPSASAPAVPHEVILAFRPAADARQRAGVLAELGATSATPLGRSGALRVELAALTNQQAMTLVGGHPAVAYVEPNFLVSAAAIPNDTYFAQQWALRNTGQTGGTPGADIRATEAWDLLTGAPNVTIAILDSGIDLTHPDLAANLFVNPGEVAGNGLDDDGNGFIDDTCGWDFFNHDNDASDDNGHGTFMAGIMGAAGDNGRGIAGVCWSVRLLPIKFLGASGTGTTADAILALDYAVTMGVQVTNNSWGGGPFTQALLEEIQAADQAGVVFVASAGATSADLDLAPQYPASYDVPNVVAVAATDHNDQLTTASNWGDKTVDLAAPGAGILTTYLGSSYRNVSGTSTAAAHVSGALALVFQRFPGISGAAAIQHILGHVEVLPSLIGLVITGGRLDAYTPVAEALTAVEGDERWSAGARGTLRLWWQGARDGAVFLGAELPRRESDLALDIVDVRGRRIRALAVGPQGPGRCVLQWDGCDDRGGRAAAGVYLARLRTSDGPATASVVLRR